MKLYTYKYGGHFNFDIVLVSSCKIKINKDKSPSQPQQKSGRYAFLNEEDFAPLKRQCKLKAKKHIVICNEVDKQTFDKALQLMRPAKYYT